MGHGNAASGFRDNAVFGFLQDALREAGADNYYIATVEGEPDLMKILPRIEERGFRKVILAPFMVVALPKSHSGTLYGRCGRSREK